MALEKWRKTDLTFQIKAYPRNNLGKNITLTEISRAFDIWSEQVPLNFIYKENGTADIDIEFVPAEQGDGPYRSVAFAYFPETGKAYFDDEEWTADSEEGINLFIIAAHEFGHALGLDHSPEEDSLMHEYPPLYEPNYQLHRVDRASIKALYGVTQSFCDTGNIDAIFTTDKNILYVIKDGFCWKYKDQQLELNYPKYLSEEWLGVPTLIDAAYFYNGNIYFVEQMNTWIYDNAKVYKTVARLDMTVDAATTAGRRLYFFKGSKYWKYEQSALGIVLHSNFPKSIANFWKGIPSSVDAVYYDNDRYMYFFKGKTVYTFDIFNKLEAAVAQSIEEWMVCKK